MPLRLPRRRSRRAALTVAATVLIAAGAAACGAQDPGAASGTGTGSTATSPGAAAATEMTTIGGAKLKLPGDKPAALFFFSVGCGECVNGASSLAQAGQALGGKASVVAVDMDPSESPKTIGEFLGSIDGPNLPVVIDKGAALSQKYTVAAPSTLIVVDPAGQVTFRATDPGPDKIQAALETAGAR
ncbi:thiol-disulfide isomerase/thioredoxin [Kribbella aluminosa]|uniref:Thiol-disulfide isomerase/thioredoxin n=1 Tax=Kribbella aluminosa TaxID=416017 RepID=A0ABS4UWI5_9ACTN|nr:redoxin domain-containing protein [Kribbella aluminosa]MBP2356002.1 thiol-disulfide isomerase/thioredoxin [Kribbella aluminosa]